MDHRVCDQTLVERRQLSAARDGECEQITVSHLRGIEKTTSIKALLIKKGDLVRPEFMAGQSPQGCQQLCNCSGSARRVRVSGITYDAQETILCERAGCPGLLAARCEPFVCAVMLNVRGIDERDQNIDVEEKPRHGNSSRS